MRTIAGMKRSVNMQRSVNVEKRTENKRGSNMMRSGGGGGV